MKSVTYGGGSLEGLEGGTDALSGQLDRMREGTYVEGEDGGAEAIVLRFTRPVFLVQDSVVTPPADVNTFAGGESAVIEARMNAAAPFLKAAIPRAGRINLANHRMDWVGTGSVVMDMATGQAVALHFGGFEGDRNMAVQAPVVADRLAAHT